MSNDTRSQAQVCPPDHSHATSTTCYFRHRCRCTPCKDLAIGRQGTRRKLIAYGRWEPRVPATVTRGHIRVLRASGVGYRRIATLAQINASHIDDISSGRTLHVSADLERRVRAITVDAAALAHGSIISSPGTRRRVQALFRCGWSGAAIGERIGVHGTNISRLVNETRVTIRTAELIAELYEALWNTPPTNSLRSQEHSRRRAALSGWLPPLAWDDIDADPEPPSQDDVETVDVMAVSFVVQGERVALTRAERHVALTQLHSRGYLDPELALMLNVDRKTIGRDRAHLGLPANYSSREGVAA